MVKVLQISDTHLFADRDHCVLGIPTAASLALVMADVQQNHSDADACLLTGDLVQDASEKGYHRLLEQLAPLQIPKYSLPGNHDERPVMHKVLEAAGVSINGGFACGAWWLVMLDSLVPDHEHGMLSVEELRRLDHELNEHRQQPCLVAVHHPPVMLGSTWIDGMNLKNHAELFAVLDRHPQVQALIWGHAHQEYSGHRNGVTLLGAPSTCVQFLPFSETYASDTLHPGYRALHLHDDGTLGSEFCLVAEFPFTANNKDGYG